jgi:hypothetical protein
MIALCPTNPQVDQRAEFGAGLDAFGDQLRASVISKFHQSRPEGTSSRIGVDPASQGNIKLDDVWIQAEKMAEPGVASTGVINGEAHALAAERGQSLAESVEVLDQYMLGEFNDQPGRFG